MAKLGRNDPCHCGSGKKYKRCCLEKDEANNVTRLAPNRSGAEGAGTTPEQLVREQLAWANPLYQLVAELLVDRMDGAYSDSDVAAAVLLWKDFSEAEMPNIKKPGVFPAALEYCIAQIYGYEATQAALAQKYGVTAGSVSQRVHEIMNFMEDYDPSEEEADPTPLAAPVQPSASRIAMEREMRRINELLESRNFSSVEEANAFLQQMNSGAVRPSRKRKRSKQEQATELLYDAWEEPRADKRVRMAREALLLYPDSADAYNILAESAAASVKEMAYYYKQGMLAGERDLGGEFFAENKGHFWGITPTRPYMRAKKGYAEACYGLENIDEAIKQYNELLELNPNDNQGVRDLLLIALLETEDWTSGAKLIETYREDGSACFNYDRILVEYGMRGLTKKLSRLLADAVKQNPHVPKFLLGKKRIPRQMPEYIGFGDEAEAIVYAQTHYHLWQSKPELQRWLGSGV